MHKWVFNESITSFAIRQEITLHNLCNHAPLVLFFFFLSSKSCRRAVFSVFVSCLVWGIIFSSGAPGNTRTKMHTLFTVGLKSCGASVF